MVQVVGKDPAVVKRKTCKHCSSILEYLPIDIRKGKSYDYTGSYDIYKYITCPTCNEQVVVSNY